MCLSSLLLRWVLQATKSLGSWVSWWSFTETKKSFNRIIYLHVIRDADWKNCVFVEQLWYFLIHFMFTAVHCFSLCRLMLSASTKMFFKPTHQILTNCSQRLCCKMQNSPFKRSANPYWDGIAEKPAFYILTGKTEDASTTASRPFTLKVFTLHF